MARSFKLLAGATVALIAALFATAASAAQVDLGRSLLQAPTEFPPLCVCNRNNTQSPWRLTESMPVVDGQYSKQCFTIANVGGCDPTLKCCNGQGVEKVEFDVVNSCKDSLKRVTVNGALKSFEYNTKLSVLRITNLNLSATAAPGTEICLLTTLTSTCATSNGICGTSGTCKYAFFNQDRDCCPVSVIGAVPPPPIVPAFGRVPPPPPTSFPWCRCERNPALSKYTTVAGDVGIVGNLTKVCFKVDVKDSLCPLGSPCCSFELFKFEIDANPACSSSLVYTTLDGVKRVRFFQQNPYPVIKVNNINKPFSAVDGTEVCLFLRKPCNSAASLCTGAGGKCTIALFNKPGSNPSCCPLSIA